MDNKERIGISQKKAADTIESAMTFSMGDIFAFYQKLSPLTKGTAYRQYTKKGPGRYHQNASRAELKARTERKHHA